MLPQLTEFSSQTSPGSLGRVRTSDKHDAQRVRQGRTKISNQWNIQNPVVISLHVLHHLQNMALLSSLYRSIVHYSI